MLQPESKKTSRPKKNKKSNEHDHVRTGHDHSLQLTRLSRIKGQVEGIERMVVENRYCPDIVMQIKAIRAALKSLQSSISEDHIRHCVKSAIQSRNPKVVQEKIEEVLYLMKGQE